MRVCVVSLNRFVHDARARVLVRSLVHAGHEVVVVAAGSGPDEAVDGAEVRYVPTRYPTGPGPWRRRLRLLQPRALRTRLFHRRLAAAAASAGADIVHPTSAAAVRIAVRAGVPVARDPAWPSAGARDLIDLAPGRSGASVSGAGPGLDLHTAVAAPGESVSPAPGRHRGRRLALCYRKTDTNPGRYLEAALRRAGFELEVHTDVVPWTRLDPGVEGVVFVESPYPALRGRGTNPGFPVLFWVHHGEHRLLTNIRLCDQYGAHAVLLAHSWHLAHRFPVPVHRFPFAVAPELFSSEPPATDDRRFDVAFVGAGLEGGNVAYEHRRRLLSAIESELGADRVAFAGGIEAAEMASLYERARIVVDEGGTRHFPITMRVFEALGAGAALLTEEAPGLPMLLDRDAHYAVLDDDAAGVGELLGDAERLRRLAVSGYAEARRRHTYDHRVDDLVAVLDTVRGVPTRPEPPIPGGLAGLIGRDVEVQRLVAFGAPGLETLLPLHEVRDGADYDDPPPASFDASVIGPAYVGDLESAVAAARRFVYAGAHHDEVARLARLRAPQAMTTRYEDVLKIDLVPPQLRP